MLKKFFRQFSHYSLGQLLVLLSTFVSFPLLTRIFTVRDYGIMNLISDALLILGALSKAGLQNSVVRFYDEFSASKDKQKLNALVTSLLTGGAGLALLVTVACIAVIFFLPHAWLRQSGSRLLLLISCGLIFLRAVESLLQGFLRAEQQTFFLNTYRVVVKYLGLGMILVFVFFISRSLKAFYLAQVISTGTALAVLLAWRVQKSPLRRPDWSGEIFRRALIYGFPLIGFELVSMLLAYADRYLIQYYLGAEAVGLYSAAYNMVDYVKDLIVIPLSSAVMPIYMEAWFNEGEKATSDFLQRALRSYALLAVPLVFGCAAIGKNFIYVLASEKFVGGYIIIPWVMSGLMINGALPILAAGLYIQDKTNKLVGLLGLTAAINFVANMILIPRFGIQGAAMAKVFSYFLLVIFAAALSNKVVNMQMPWSAFAKYCLAGAVMFAVITGVHISSPVIELIADVGIGAAVYFPLVLLFDTSIREKTMHVVHAQLKRLSPEN